MDEVSSHVRLDLPFVCRQGRPIDCSASSSNPMMEGPWCRFRREARAREQHRHAAVDSLKVLDPKWPIREATKSYPHVPTPPRLPPAPQMRLPLLSGLGDQIGSSASTINLARSTAQ